MSQTQNTYQKGHKLSEINPETRTAICKICGPVEIVKATFSKKWNKQFFRCENAFPRKTDKPHYSKSHSLTCINEETGMGTCSNCGEVKVHKRVNSKTGAVSWACHESLLASRIKIRDKKAIANPRKPKHRLLSFNPDTQKGICEICGETPITRRYSGGDISSKNEWRCPGSTRDFRIKAAYGLNRSDYDTMFEKQEGKCACCHQPWDQKLRVDHCHITGKIRSLLCNPCNLILGISKESSDRLLFAAEYLDLHKSELPSCPSTQNQL